MKKRILSVLLIFSILISFVPAVYAEDVTTSGTCGENLTWNFDEASGTLTVSGSGDMQEDVPWRDLRKKITQIILPDGLTSICDFAFWQIKITEIQIPDSVTQIGYCAFYSTPITEIELPEGIKSIDGFTGCDALESVYIPEGVTAIADSAFYGCTKLSDIEIPNTVTYIGSNAFAWCYELEQITIPEGVTIINIATFEGCVNLRNVELPESLITIGEEAFAGTALTSIDIPESVATIGTGAFQRCPELTSIFIPASVTDLGDSWWYSQFRFCDNLTGIWVDDNNPNYSSDEKGVLFNKNKTKLIICPGGYVGECYIPETVTSISELAISGCADLTYIQVDPDNPKYVNDAFGVLFNKEMTTLCFELPQIVQTAQKCP